MARGEHAPLAPGVARVRLESSDGTADVLLGILREHPAVEVLSGPDRYSGGRIYLLVQVRKGDSLGGAR